MASASKKADKTKHINATTWAKGTSGNPGGKSVRVGPDGETLAEMARAYTLTALNVLVGVCQSETAENKDKIVAANGILDRGWGKPKEMIDVGVQESVIDVLLEARKRAGIT